MKKNVNEEYNIQVEVVMWMREQYPDLLFTTSPGGLKLPIGLAVKQKRMGYLKGTPDLLIFAARGGFHGLFVELKTKEGVMSKEQIGFFNDAIMAGYCPKLARGFDEAINIISKYMKGFFIYGK